MIQELTRMKTGLVNMLIYFPFCNSISNINVIIYRQGVKQCSEAWRNITSDHTILEAVQGMKINFSEMPDICMSFTRQTRFSSSECEVIEGEIQKLLKENIIRPCPPEEGKVIS